MCPFVILSLQNINHPKFEYLRWVKPWKCRFTFAEESLGVTIIIILPIFESQTNLNNVTRGIFRCDNHHSPDIWELTYLQQTQWRKAKQIQTMWQEESLSVTIIIILPIFATDTVEKSETNSSNMWQEESLGGSGTIIILPLMSD